MCDCCSMLLKLCTYLYFYIFPLYSFLAKLIELLEVLVGHSISSVELKSFLRLLAPNKDQQLPGYAHMMQRTLVNVAVKDTHNLPLHSIDLNAAESVSHNFTCILLCKIVISNASCVAVSNSVVEETIYFYRKSN